MRVSEKMMKKINDLERLELSHDIRNTKTTDDNVIRKRTETISSIHSDSTLKSNLTERTIQSKPFNKELDLDLPEFSPTKYASSNFKIPHSIFYFLFSGFLLGSNICYIISNNYSTYNILSLISHTCYFISSFLEWFYYKRGCIGYANLNSRVKENIDKSLKARILRSEQGWKYFFSFFASIILIYGNIFYIMDNIENGKDEENGIFPCVEFWNINLIGVMIISLAQILKIAKILTENRQYVIKNDLSKCLIEIFLYFASLFFGTLYYFNILYNDYEIYELLYQVSRIGGCIFTIFSSMCLIHRYYMSSYDDLNASDLSNVTI